MTLDRVRLQKTSTQPEWVQRTLSASTNGALVGAMYGTFKGAQENFASRGETHRWHLRRFLCVPTPPAAADVADPLWVVFFMAVYASSLSALEHLRAGKRGLENSAGAGAFTGLAVALVATRRVPVVAMSAVLSAGLMVGVDASRRAVVQLAESAGQRLAAAKARGQ